MTIDDMPIETSVGPARVIEIKDEKQITVAELEPYNIQEGERILFKTKNSPKVWAERTYAGDFVTISLEAAEYLADKKIRLVGMDYLTIADKNPPEMINDVHRAFLSKGIYIIEALNMDGVAPGDYEMVCLPLRIEKGDAGPCRVVIRPLK
jgi:arylformamidase